MTGNDGADSGRGYFVPPRPRNIAHRGLAVDAPENTLAAFRAALAAGATHLETDVHASSDGVAVISHDPDLRRVLGKPGRIDQLAMSELSEIDLGGGNGFAALSAALDEFRDARFNIDIKSEAAVPGTIEAIRAAGAVDRVLVVSFDEKRRASAVAGLPGVATAASSFGMKLVVAGVKLGLRPLVRRGLRGVDAVQVPERYGRIHVVTPPLVRAVHAAGREIHVWTVNDPADMRRLLRLGVDGLISDRCDLVRGVFTDASCE